eukprot:GAHX01002219.1.p1 GENE.GAHX01002219.1~~GAHX01002219.1.p1  ORF type:complete len:1100 (+),score=197.69 GAHX01002219.1:1-3300(+)
MGKNFKFVMKSSKEITGYLKNIQRKILKTGSRNYNKALGQDLLSLEQLLNNLSYISHYKLDNAVLIELVGKFLGYYELNLKPKCLVIEFLDYLAQLDERFGLLIVENPYISEKLLNQIKNNENEAEDLKEVYFYQFLNLMSFELLQKYDTGFILKVFKIVLHYKVISQKSSVLGQICKKKLLYYTLNFFSYENSKNISLEIFRYFISLIQSQKTSLKKNGIVLCSYAIKNTNIEENKPLLDVIFNKLSESIIKESETTEILPLLLKLIYTLFIKLKHKMKVQLEVFFKSIFLSKLAKSKPFIQFKVLEIFFELLNEERFIFGIFKSKSSTDILFQFIECLNNFMEYDGQEKAKNKLKGLAAKCIIVIMNILDMSIHKQNRSEVDSEGKGSQNFFDNVINREINICKLNPEHIFNQEGMKSLERLSELEYIKSNDPVSLATFLFDHKTILPEKLTELLVVGNQFFEKALKNYIILKSYKDISLDKALKNILQTINISRLESQKIEMLLTIFSEAYVETNIHIWKEDYCSSVIYSICYYLLMLHTIYHNETINEKLDFDSFDKLIQTDIANKINDDDDFKDKVDIIKKRLDIPSYYQSFTQETIIPDVHSNFYLEFANEKPFDCDYSNQKCVEIFYLIISIIQQSIKSVFMEGNLHLVEKYEIRPMFINLASICHKINEHVYLKEIVNLLVEEGISLLIKLHNKPDDKRGELENKVKDIACILLIVLNFVKLDERMMVFFLLSLSIEKDCIRMFQNTNIWFEIYTSLLTSLTKEIIANGSYNINSSERSIVLEMDLAKEIIRSIYYLYEYNSNKTFYLLANNNLLTELIGISHDSTKITQLLIHTLTLIIEISEPLHFPIIVESLFAYSEDTIKFFLPALIESTVKHLKLNETMDNDSLVEGLKIFIKASKEFSDDTKKNLEIGMTSLTDLLYTISTKYPSELSPKAISRSLGAISQYTSVAINKKASYSEVDFINVIMRSVISNINRDSINDTEILQMLYEEYFRINHDLLVNYTPYFADDFQTNISLLLFHMHNFESDFYLVDLYELLHKIRTERAKYIDEVSNVFKKLIGQIMQYKKYEEDSKENEVIKQIITLISTK